MPSANVRWPVPLVRQKTLHPGQMGVPGTDSERGLRTHASGAIFYVDPNAAGVSDLRDGTDPEGPLQTVGAALARCQAYSGDVVAIMPNGVWQYASGTERPLPITEEVTVDVSGVRIVGLSPSPLGVYWQPASNDGVCITVNAMDVTIEGIAFWNTLFTGGTGISALWDGPPYGENLVVRHCYFDADLDYGVSMDFSWYNHIHDCMFVNIDIAAIFNMDVEGDPDYLQIYRNFFVDCDLAISLQDCSDCNVYGNWIRGDPTVADSYIDFAGGGGNLVSDNWLGSTLAQYAGVGGNCADGTADFWVNNHCVDGDTVAAP